MTTPGVPNDEMRQNGDIFVSEGFKESVQRVQGESEIVW